MLASQLSSSWMRPLPLRLFLLTFLLPLSTSLSSTSISSALYPFQNASLPLPVRLSNLLSLLTLDEKLSLLYQTAPPIPRLSIPRYDFGQECLHGLINRRSDLTQDGASTAFPQSIGLAASWNRTVLSEMGRVIGDEARGKRNLRLRTNDTTDPAYAPTYLMCWTPVVNILKDPRWGRSAETYGEAPLLTYALTSSLVAALHGDDPHYIKIAPVLKHFTAYDGPEEGRDSFNAVVSPRDLRDTFTFVYRRLIEEEPSHVRGMMASYSALNGVPVACDFDLLTQTTRYDWGWRDGHIVSDCDAVTGVYAAHHYTPDIVSAAALSLIAGLDVDCGSGFNNLTQALEQGLIQPADVDVALSHAATIQFRLGFYDAFGLSPYDSVDPSVVDSPSHRQAALDITHQSMVLLKNDGTLPLRLDRLKRVAVIGPSANDSDEWQQCFYAGGGSCLLHHIYHAYSSFLVQPLQGIEAYVANHSASVQVGYGRGCARYTNDSSGFDEALRLANSSDVAIFIGGLDYYQEEEDTDRSTLELPDIQRRLLAALGQLTTPLVSVLIHGGAISDDVLEASSNAILSAFYPGEWAGTAIADLLFGAVNPSGRLPYTVYTNTSQLPSIGDDRMANGLGRTYAFLSTPPRYYFGDGLSYTSHSYGGLNVTLQGTGLQVSVNVTNTGAMAGDEVVQLYAAYDAAFSGLPASVAPPSLSVPRRFLLDFVKVHVPAHSTVAVQLLVPFTQLTAFGRWTLPEPDTADADLPPTPLPSSPSNASRLTPTEVRQEIARMREMRRRLESGEVGRRGRAELGNVTLPVWVSVGGRQPTPQRMVRGEVLVQSVTVNAPIDDVVEEVGTDRRERAGQSRINAEQWGQRE